MKTSMRSMLMALTFLSLAVGPKAHAVVPPPDGGYPGGNTAEGQNALLSLTSGGYNTAVGAGALVLNSAEENTAIGTGALLLNTVGVQNTANGALALFSNTSGDENTAIGIQALSLNTTGQQNTAVGGIA